MGWVCLFFKWVLMLIKLLQSDLLVLGVGLEACQRVLSFRDRLLKRPSSNFFNFFLLWAVLGQLSLFCGSSLVVLSILYSVHQARLLFLTFLFIVLRRMVEGSGYDLIAGNVHRGCWVSRAMHGSIFLFQFPHFAVGSWTEDRLSSIYSFSLLISFFSVQLR